MKNLKPCIVVYLLLTALTGIAYPLLITGISRIAFPDKANGSLIQINGEIRGSSLIGQNFTNPAYFWSRPSACSYGTLPSSASNQGPTSEALKQAVDTRRKYLAQYILGEIPTDLLLASGSGLDSHISPEAAITQIGHVATARNLSPEQISSLDQLVRQLIEKPQWGIFGAPRINVLKLNLEVDRLFGTS
jgi:potassium-transporting ATPase KdpC subunit